MRDRNSDGMGRKARGSPSLRSKHASSPVSGKPREAIAGSCRDSDYEIALVRGAVHTEHTLPGTSCRDQGDTIPVWQDLVSGDETTTEDKKLIVTMPGDDDFSASAKFSPRIVESI